MKIVRINWDDAVADACWTDIHVIQSLDVQNCQTVAYLVQETDTCYKMTSTIGDDGLAMGYIIIPKRFIQSVQVLDDDRR